MRYDRLSSEQQPAGRQHFLSEADCRDIARRLARAATGGGVTAVAIWSHWNGHVRWARNQLVTSGDIRNDYIKVDRDINGAENSFVLLNQATDAALVAAARRAERLVALTTEDPEWDLGIKRYQPEDATTPKLFSDATYQLDAEHRANAAIALTKSAAAAGMMSAGYIEMWAHSLAVIDSLGHVRYVPYTQASYSVTVRDPDGSGSGWAGVDWPDWSRIDAPKITEVALQKCLTSRHPVAIEPGRYTTILEPQAVSDFVGQLVLRGALSKVCNEWDCQNSAEFPFTGTPRADPQKGIIGMTLLGNKIVDERLSIWADPMDPDLGFTPFKPDLFAGSLVQDVDVFHPATWIKDGVLTQLEYDRDFAVSRLGLDNGLPNEGGFRMSGGTTSIEEMIAATKRGLLVTRFVNVIQIDKKSQLYRGYTRDGLWLIEGGKIAKPVKNMVFTESILFGLNNIEQLGVPQRVFHPATGRLTLPQPIIVPSLKIKDFSFTALTDAI